MYATLESVPETNQYFISNEGKDSCSTKRREPLAGIDLTRSFSVFESVVILY